jgi:hypothetical protein
MSDKEFSKAADTEQRLVVKNKKYKKGDIFAFALCLLVALVIWIHATNTENEQNLKKEELLDNLSEVSEQK